MQSPRRPPRHRRANRRVDRRANRRVDRSPQDTKLRAYIYSAPTLVDLEGDGALEVAVGTSMGFVYVLDAASGALRDGFPVQVPYLPYISRISPICLPSI